LGEEKNDKAGEEKEKDRNQAEGDFAETKKTAPKMNDEVIKWRVKIFAGNTNNLGNGQFGDKSCPGFIAPKPTGEVVVDEKVHDLMLTEKNAGVNFGYGGLVRVGGEGKRNKGECLRL